MAELGLHLLVRSLRRRRIDEMQPAAPTAAAAAAVADPIQDGLSCPICYDIFYEPVTLQCQVISV